MRSATTEKPCEVSEIQPTPKGKQNKKVPPAGAHGRQQAPEGEAGQTQPKNDPVEGKKAEEAEGGGGNKAANLGGIDRVEIKVLDLGSDKRASAQGLV